MRHVPCPETAASDPQSASATDPNQQLGIEIVGPFPQSKHGNVYLLVMVDFFSKWAAPLPNQEAHTGADAIIDHWVSRFGVPDSIHSDQGSNFENRLVYEVCERLGAHKTWTTAYHPQGNGQTERTNRSLVSLLKAFVHTARYDIWDELISYCLFSYSNTVHQATGVAPALMTLGHELQLPLDLHTPPNTPASSTTRG